MGKINNKKVTITDVAKAANVSIATVSRIINDRDGNIKISEQTKCIVHEKIKELNYQQNVLASALRARRSGLIGAVIRDISDPFLLKIVKYFQTSAKKRGLEILLGNANYSDETTERQLSLMINHLFDGLIIFTVTGDKFIENLKQSGIRYVTVTGGYDSLHKPRVLTNDTEGVYLALTHLVQLGHREIGFIGSPEEGVRKRFEYFQQFFIEKNLTLNTDFVEMNGNSITSISNYVDKLLKYKIRPSAIFCATDSIAIRVINVSHHNGLQIPRDFSIVGFDDIDEANEFLPLLTTIQQPYEELAERGLDLLLQLIEEPSSELFESEFVISPRLVIRGSSIQFS